jgi:hypothetical protein
MLWRKLKRMIDEGKLSKRPSEDASRLKRKPNENSSRLRRKPSESKSSFLRSSNNSRMRAENVRKMLLLALR